MEQCREAMQFHRLALRTEEAYLQRIKRFLVFHRGTSKAGGGKRSPEVRQNSTRHPTLLYVSFHLSCLVSAKREDGDAVRPAGRTASAQIKGKGMKWRELTFAATRGFKPP